MHRIVSRESRLTTYVSSAANSDAVSTYMVARECCMFVSVSEPEGWAYMEGEEAPFENGSILLRMLCADSVHVALAQQMHEPQH